MVQQRVSRQQVQTLWPTHHKLCPACYIGCVIWQWLPTYLWYLMDLHSFCRVNMLRLHEPSGVVCANWDGRQIKGSVFLTNLLEDSAVACVPSKPEALGCTHDCPPTPQALPPVIPCSGAPVLHQVNNVRVSCNVAETM